MKIEIRADQVILDGYINAVGRDSRPLPSPKGRFLEQVEPATFRRAIEKRQNVELRFNHSRVIGGTADGSLELFEDNIGLHGRGVVTDSEVVAAARAGSLRGWSFGFTAIKDRWEDVAAASDGMQRRYLEEIDLSEVSILTKTPAYIATSVEVRGEEEQTVEHRHFEDGSPELSDEKREVERDKREVAKNKIKILKMKGRNYEHKSNN